MKLLGLAGLAGACLATSHAYAADLFGSAPPPMDAPAVQTELGSNWYIRGDIGYGQTDQATIVPQKGLFPQQINAGVFSGATWSPYKFADGTPLTFNGAPIGDANNPAAAARGNNLKITDTDFNVGFGYRVNDWFRVEANYSFFRGPGYGAQTTVFCPGQASSVSNYQPQTTTTTNGGITTSTTTYSPVPYGYTYDWSTCNGYLNATQVNNMGMVSAYADLGHWWLFSPYIGVGGGLNANTLTGTMQYYSTANGQIYPGPQVNGTAPALWVVNTGAIDPSGHPVYAPLVDKNGKGPNMLIGPQNWRRSIDSTKYTIAAQVSAGVGIQLSQSATLDLGYRITTTDISSGVKGMRQSVNLGVRYNIN